MVDIYLESIDFWGKLCMASVVLVLVISQVYYYFIGKAMDRYYKVFADFNRRQVRKDFLFYLDWYSVAKGNSPQGFSFKVPYEALLSEKKVDIGRYLTSDELESFNKTLKEFNDDGRFADSIKEFQL